MNDEILQALLKFISTSFMVDPGEIDLDRSLVDAGIIDSFGLIEISSFLEATYGLKVPDDEMNRANFGSVNRIVAYVERKRAA